MHTPVASAQRPSCVLEGLIGTEGFPKAWAVASSIQTCSLQPYLQSFYMSADRDLQAALFLQLEENVRVHYQANGLKQHSLCQLNGSTVDAFLRALPGGSEDLIWGAQQLKSPDSQPAAGSL